MSPATSPLPASAGSIVQAAWRSPTAVDLVLLLAVGSNCVLILAPMQPSTKDTNHELGAKELTNMLLPTFALFAQCFLWACYGYFIEQPDIAHFNAFGAALCLVYLACLAGGPKQRRQSQPLLVVGVTIIAAFVATVLSLPMSALSRSTVFAYAAMLCSFLQSFAPVCQAVEVVFSGKDATSSTAVALATFVSSALWAQYAFMVRDRLYLLSNTLNAMVGAVGLVILGSGFVGRLSRGMFSKLDPDDQPLMPRAKKNNVLVEKLGHKFGWEYGSAQQLLDGNVHIEERLSLLRPHDLSNDAFLPPEEAQGIRAGLRSAFGVLQVEDSAPDMMYDQQPEPELQANYGLRGEPVMSSGWGANRPLAITRLDLEVPA